jgi:RNA-directed DNA polymerase
MRKKQIYNNLPKITSFGKLESILGIRRELLREVAKDIKGYYKPFRLNDSKSRYIENPIGNLKFIQHRIDTRILKKIKLPGTILGGVSGKSTTGNADLHKGRRSIVTLDIKDCFPNTKDKWVFDLFKKLGYSTRLASLLTRLTTFKTHLPVGSPSSTSLINLLLLPIHDEMLSVAMKNGFNCSFWVDDIAISGECPKLFLKDFIKILQDHGYSVRSKKIKIMPRSNSQVVTGILVNKKIKVPKEKIKEYENNIFKLKGSDDFSSKLTSVEGQIQYVKQINKKQGEALQKLKIRTISSGLK